MTQPPAAPGPTGRQGVVTSFDDHVGLGRVGDDVASWEFHCTQLADGSRTVEVGTEVAFELRPARAGRVEAFDLRRIHRP